MADDWSWRDDVRSFFRWQPLQAAWDGFWATTWGKAVIAAATAVVVGFFAYVETHPALFNGALGALAASGFIFLATWIQFKKPKLQNSDSTRTFKKFSSSSVLGIISGKFSDFEYQWDQTEIAFRTAQITWNRIWGEVQEVIKRKDLSQEERNTLTGLKMQAGRDPVIRAFEVFADRLQRLNEIVQEFDKGESGQ